MSKYGAIGLADHFGCDVATIKENEYQSGHFTQKVFVINDVYYCPYKTKAKSRFGDFFLDGHWEKFESSYHKDVFFWKFIDEEEAPTPAPARTAFFLIVAVELGRWGYGDTVKDAIKNGGILEGDLIRIYHSNPRFLGEDITMTNGQASIVYDDQMKEALNQKEMKNRNLILLWTK